MKYLLEVILPLTVLGTAIISIAPGALMILLGIGWAFILYGIFLFIREMFRLLKNINALAQSFVKKNNANN